MKQSLGDSEVPIMWFKCPENYYFGPVKTG
jgi:hypothetical protein